MKNKKLFLGFLLIIQMFMFSTISFASYKEKMVDITSNPLFFVQVNSANIYTLYNKETDNITIECWPRLILTDLGRKNLGDKFDPKFYNCKYMDIQYSFNFKTEKATQLFSSAWDNNNQLLLFSSKKSEQNLPWYAENIAIYINDQLDKGAVVEKDGHLVIK